MRGAVLSAPSGGVMLVPGRLNAGRIMSDQGDSGSAITDSFTETTTKSWGSRIGESIKGVLFGLAFTVGACVLLFWNEGREIGRAHV